MVYQVPATASEVQELQPNKAWNGILKLTDEYKPTAKLEATKINQELYINSRFGVVLDLYVELAHQHDKTKAEATNRDEVTTIMQDEALHIIEATSPAMKMSAKSDLDHHPAIGF
jgi:hypothetical protein